MAKSKHDGAKVLAVVCAIGLIAGLSLSAFRALPSNNSVLVWDRDRAVSIPRLLEEVEVRLDDLPNIVEALSRSSARESFAALAFNTSDRPFPDEAINLQISIENGKVGFDWVLLGSSNIRDQRKFAAFARAQGIEPVRRSLNGVSYLRVENIDVAEFSASIVTEMYNLSPSELLGLYHEGFDWPK